MHQTLASITYVNMRQIEEYRLSTISENRSWLTWNGSYVGQCSMSEEELQHNCSQIRINSIRCVLGVLDCQTWATLFIESLKLSVNGIGSILATVFCVGPLYSAETVVARIPDLIIDMDASLNTLLSCVKIYE